MKIVRLFFLIMSVFLVACSSDNETYYTYKVHYVDLSGLSIYAGSPQGGKEVQYNNLKRTTLAKRYFGSKYDHQLYQQFSIQFEGDRMTYVYGSSGNTAKKIVSSYEFRNDSLITFKTNGDALLVALGTDRSNMYRQQSLVFYKYKKAENEYRDTVVVSDRLFNPEIDFTKLPSVKYPSLQEMTTVSDTVVYCNVFYLFQ